MACLQHLRGTRAFEWRNLFHMKFFFLVSLAFLAGLPSVAQQVKDMYPRVAKAQKYTSEGFTPVDCFAGQVKVRGKRVTRESFSVFLPDENKKCCGATVKTAQTDEHGHFLVEPMEEGEYFAQFHFKGVEHIASFAIFEGYKRCGGSDYVQINFSDPDKAQIQESISINDSGRECEENEPQCYRK
jgi:hypothetical protein